MSFLETFLLLPMVLHRSLRESLPRSSRTSLHVWLSENPNFQAIAVDRAKAFNHITKSALLFGGAHQLFTIQGGILLTNQAFKRKINRSLRDSTDDVRNCARKASFIGTWFSESGSTETIMAIMGVRP